jgi:hypothetical protein
VSGRRRGGVGEAARPRRIDRRRSGGRKRKVEVTGGEEGGDGTCLLAPSLRHMQPGSPATLDLGVS